MSKASCQGPFVVIYIDEGKFTEGNWTHLTRNELELDWGDCGGSGPRLWNPITCRRRTMPRGFSSPRARFCARRPGNPSLTLAPRRSATSSSFFRDTGQRVWGLWSRYWYVSTLCPWYTRRPVESRAIVALPRRASRPHLDYRLQWSPDKSPGSDYPDIRGSSRAIWTNWNVALGDADLTNTTTDSLAAVEYYSKFYRGLPQAPLGYPVVSWYSRICRHQFSSAIWPGCSVNWTTWGPSHACTLYCHKCPESSPVVDPQTKLAPQSAIFAGNHFALLPARILTGEGILDGTDATPSFSNHWTLLKVIRRRVDEY